MKAAVVLAAIHPDRIPEAARLTEQELIPGFLAQPGARHGFWMAQRSSGRLLGLTLWDDEAHMRAASISEHARLEEFAKRVGARIGTVHALDVAGAHEETIEGAPRVRWVRTTWVRGCRPDGRRELPALFREAVPTQVRTRGFCASYWLVDPTLDTGLGLSFWEGPAEVRDSEGQSLRRRRRLESVLGCAVAEVHEYEALCAASTVTDPAPKPSRPQPEVGARLAAELGGLGTLLERPPGAVLAVTGEITDQVVVLVEGDAAVVQGIETSTLGPGGHFGGLRIRDRLSHNRSVVTTTPSQIGVISRLEFDQLAHTEPDVARELVEGDAEQ